MTLLLRLLCYSRDGSIETRVPLFENSQIITTRCRRSVVVIVGPDLRLFPRLLKTIRWSGRSVRGVSSVVDDTKLVNREGSV